MNIRLTVAEADWLSQCLSIAMQLSRHWDNLDPTKPDYGNAIQNKLMQAQLDRESE